MYSDLIYPLRTVAQEIELHFVLCRPVPGALGVKFIHQNYTKFQASSNENIVRNLSVYLDKAFKVRSISSS